MTISRLRAVSAVMLCSLLLIGCAAAPDVSTSTPIVKPTPTVTPTDKGEQVVTVRPPTQVPGSCSDLVPDSTLTSTLGFAVTAVAPTTSPLDRAERYQAGSLYCEWNGASGASDARLIVRVARHAELLQSYAPFSADGAFGLPVAYNNCMADTNVIYFNCLFGAVIGDYEVYGYGDGGIVGATDASLEDMTTAIISGVRTRLEAAPPVAAWQPPAGAWDRRFDCDAVAADADLSTVFSKALTVTDWTGSANTDDGGDPREVAELGGSTRCVWVTADETLADAQFLSGGAWFWSTLTDYPGYTVEQISIAGADNAAVACSATYGCEFYAQIGSNAFSFGQRLFYVEPLTRDQLIAGGTALVAALD